MNKINSQVNKLGLYCKEHRLTIVTAESCTGGGVAFAMSKSTDCSSILERGYISYSNQSKQSLLNVCADTLQTHGAVSKEVAIEMAEGSLKNSIAQVSLAITGLAGEDNDLEHNIGKAWLGVSIVDRKTFSKEIKFKGTRLQFIEFVIFNSLCFLLDCLITK